MSIFFKNFGPYGKLRTANWPIAWRKQAQPYNNPSNAESVATNEFYFLDTSRNAEERKFTSGNVRNAAGVGQTVILLTVVANYNKGFTARKALLGASATVNCEITLNRKSFFEALEDKLLPNTKIELNLEF